jgi:hypothetical protein
MPNQATKPQEADVKERTVMLPVRVTKAEKSKFFKLAEDRYTTFSELVRQLLHREADNRTSKAGG